MTTVDVADGDVRLADLVGRAEAGETLEIAREGRVVAKLVPADRAPRRIDLEALAKLRASGPQNTMTVEEMRRLDLL